MLGTRNVTAFVATTNPERARTFYEGTLGLALVSDDPWALVFSVAGTVLRVQKVDRHTPHPFTALGWRVPDITDDVAALTARGVRFERYEGMQQDAAGVWTSPNGAKVAWFKDPDGNVLSLTEDAHAPFSYGKLLDPFGHEWGVNEQRQRLTPAEEAANAERFFSKAGPKA